MVCGDTCMLLICEIKYSGHEVKRISQNLEKMQNLVVNSTKTGQYRKVRYFQTYRCRISSYGVDGFHTQPKSQGSL